ncbi:hypothetical protein EVA_14519 [gut metagenome]|uniref:Uncharacterized protein n=1 Tax=gut metagenome TaxID=749906 RepID=J9CBP6_9ZZZZ
MLNIVYNQIYIFIHLKKMKICRIKFILISHTCSLNKLQLMQFQGS